jgi:hypothetical protein
VNTKVVCPCNCCDFYGQSGGLLNARLFGLFLQSHFKKNPTCLLPRMKFFRAVHL